MSKTLLFAAVFSLNLGTFCLASVRPSIEPDFQQAQVLLGKHSWIEASILLKKVLNFDETYLPALYDLGTALLHTARREEALVYFARAINHEKNSQRRVLLIKRAQVLSRQFLSSVDVQVYQEGLGLLVAKKFGLAREKFERALEKEHDNSEILTRLGQSYLLDGDPDSAAERLKVAKRLNPFDPEISLWLGRALYQRGEVNLGLEELRYANQALPHAEQATVWLSEALASAGQRNVAIQILEKDSSAHPIHLLSLLTSARFKMNTTYGVADRKVQSTLWSIRKDLQIALSRLGDYLTHPPGQLEQDLGIELKDPEAMKLEILSLLQKVENRITPQEKMQGS